MRKTRWLIVVTWTWKRQWVVTQLRLGIVWTFANIHYSFPSMWILKPVNSSICLQISHCFGKVLIGIVNLIVQIALMCKSALRECWMVDSEVVDEWFHVWDGGWLPVVRSVVNTHLTHLFVIHFHVLEEVRRVFDALDGWFRLCVGILDRCKSKTCILRF